MARIGFRTKQIVGTLNELLLLDRESLEAYAAAIDAVDDDPMARDTMMSFRADHERHVKELEIAIRACGGVPVTTTSARSSLTKDHASFASLPSSTAMFRVLKSNEDVVVQRYRAALSLDAPSDIVEVVRRACNDQLRHRAWIAARVDAFSRAQEQGRIPRDSRSSML